MLFAAITFLPSILRGASGIQAGCYSLPFLSRLWRDSLPHFPLCTLSSGATAAAPWGRQGPAHPMLQGLQDTPNPACPMHGL